MPRQQSGSFDLLELHCSHESSQIREEPNTAPLPKGGGALSGTWATILAEKVGEAHPAHPVLARVITQ